MAPLLWVVIGFQCPCSEHGAPGVRISRKPTFFISSSRDLVVVSRRTFEDHIDWLLSNGRFRDATIEAHERRTELPEGRADEVGQICIEKLFENSMWWWRLLCVLGLFSGGRKKFENYFPLPQRTMPRRQICVSCCLEITASGGRTGCTALRRRSSCM